VLKIISKSAFWIVLGVFLVPGMVVAAEGLNLEEGYWETYVTIGIEGGLMPVPAIKSSKCITREDPLPNSIESGRMHCRVFDKSISDSDVTWRLECGDEKGRMEGTGKITYRGDKFSGSMNVEVSEAEQNRHAKLIYEMKGNRVRACDEPEPK
jgi:Protein of unknown function (DUF3617)